MDDLSLLKYYKSSDVLRLNEVKIPYVELWYGGKEGVSEKDLSCFLMSENFIIDPKIAEKIDELKNSIDLGNIQDNVLARLHHFKYKNGKLELYFQKTSYEYFYLTNFQLDQKLDNWKDCLRDIIAPDPLHFLDSPLNFCGNPLGVNAIIETADNPPVIVLQKRTEQVATDKNVFGSSVGGSLEIIEGKPISLYDTLREEMREELGLLRDDIQDIKLVSIFRELQNGGKPTAYFKITTKNTLKEIQNVVEKNEFQDGWEFNDLKDIMPSENIINKMIFSGYIDKTKLATSTRCCLYYYKKN